MEFTLILYDFIYDVVHLVDIYAILDFDDGKADQLEVMIFLEYLVNFLKFLAKEGEAIYLLDIKEYVTCIIHEDIHVVVVVPI